MFRQLLLWFFLLFGWVPVAGLAQSSPIAFPDPDICQQGDAPQSTVPLTPGRWWNPQRPGTGWDLAFAAGGESLYLTWFTYDAAGRPTWLVSEVTQWAAQSATWRSRLVRYRYVGEMRVGENVGWVALHEVAGQPNKVAVNWRLDGVTVDQPECLEDYARLGLRSPDGPANTTLSGSWIQDDYDLRYGVSVSVFQGSDSLYYEWPYLLTYDSTGMPVWLAADKSDVAPPQYGVPGSRDFTYDYLRSNYTGGLPTATGAAGCGAGLGCFSVTPTTETFERVYTDAQSGTWSMDVDYLNPATGQRIVFERDNVGMIKLTDVNQVLVNVAGCTIPSGTRTCPVQVDVSLANGVSAQVYRLNVANQTRSMLFTPPSGTITDALPTGQFRYELRTSSDFSQPPLAQSWVVQVVEDHSGIVNGIGFNDPGQCTGDGPDGGKGLLLGKAGGAALTPGTWWNPARNGTGWDLTLIQSPGSGLEQLLATWFTYERPTGSTSASGRPVWLYTLPNQIETLPNGDRRWWSPLFHYQWDFNASSATAGLPVGEVSLVFPAGDPTRAALRWRWSQASAVVQNECLQDFTRAVEGGDQPANAAFSGPWFEPGWPDYGYQVAIAPLGSQYIELGTLAVYDTAGNPVWVQGQRTGLTGPPALNDPQPVTLTYYTSPYTSTAYPLTDCVSGSCDPAPSSAGEIWREFLSPASLRADIDVSASVSLGSGVFQSINWRRPPESGNQVTMEKVVAGSQVLIDRVSCTVPCSVQIDFASDPRNPDSAAARLYRRNLDTQAVVSILNQPTGVHTDTVSGAGRYRYELLRWDAPGAPPLAYSAELVVSAGGGGGGGGNVDPPPAPVADPGFAVDIASQRSGASRGEFRVDESGALNYSLPIMVMPGSGNMAPDLALAYSSRGGAGPVGLGWQISGQSSINRCGTATEFGDASARPITLTPADQYCLDGQRLKLVSGSHGQTNAVYRLEVDHLVRVTIVAVDGTLQAPTHFRVERKDGTRSIYGSDGSAELSSARVLTNFPVGTQTIFSWPLAQIADRAGNYMNYQYQHGSEGIEYVLSAVKYTGNTVAGTPTYAEVRFDYSNLNLVERALGWVAGAKTARTLRLNAIRSLGEGGQVLRYYRLTWDNDRVHTQLQSNTGRSILSAVAECYSSAPADCLPATSFNWITGAQRMDAAGAHNPSASFADFRYASPADLNGDGRLDLVVVRGAANSAAKLQVLLAQSNGSFSVGPDFTAACGLKIDDLKNLQAIDLTGNGFQGIVYAATKCTAAVNNGIYYHALQGNTLTSGVKLVAAPNTGSTLPTSTLTVVDFNGDGLADLMLDFPGGGTAAAASSGSEGGKGGEEGSEGGEGGERGNFGGWFPGAARPPIWLYANQAPSLPPGTVQVFGEGVQMSGGFDWLEGSQAIEVCPPEHPVEQYLFNVELDRAGAFTVDGSGRPAVLANARVYVECVDALDLPDSSTIIDLAGPGGDGPITNPVVAERHRIFQIEEPSNGVRELSSYADVADVFGTANYMPTDVNGDGLTDMVTVRTGNCQPVGCEVRLQINHGAGLGAVQSQGYLSSNLAPYARLLDYNGDGFPDLLYPNTTNMSSAKWQVRFWEGAQVNGALVGRFRTQVYASPTVAGNMSEGWQSQFLDWTGNGLTDQALFRKSGNNFVLDIARGTVTTGGVCITTPCYANLHAIKRVTDGLGAWTEVDYGSLAQRSVYTRDNNGPYRNWGLGAPVYDFIAPIYVVSTARSLAPRYELNANATGSTYDAAGTTLTRYYYTGAKIQAGGRGFLGFAEVASFDPQSAMLTRTRYKQQFPFIGVPERTESSYQTAAPWTQSDAVAALTPCTGGCTNNAISSGIVLGLTDNTWASQATVAGLVHPYLAQIDVRSWLPVFDSNGVVNGRAFVSRNRTTNSNLDQYGNVRSVNKVDYEDENAFTPFATQLATNLYNNTEASWQLGLLNCTTVTSSRTGETPVTRLSSFAYHPTTGILTRETVQPASCTNTSGAEINTTHTLNSFGLVVETTTTARDASGSRQMKKIYDSYGRYIDGEEVFVAGSFKRVSTVNTRDRFGNPTQTTNAQGVVSKAYFDALGRPHYSYSSTGAWNRVLFASGIGSSLCPAGTALREEHTAGGGLRSTVCKDLLGREIRKISWTIQGTASLVDTHYDYASRPVETSEPYIQGQNSYWARTVYDEFGRVEFLRLPDNSLQSNTYLARQTRSTNALGQTTIKEVNAVGEVVIETVAYNTPDQAQTTHSYDALGRLKWTDGPLNGAVDRITLSYNLAGQRTQVVDPDKGTWQYRHNGYGELICQIDAKAQGIFNTYDELGRMVARSERTGVSNLSTCTGTPRGTAGWTYNDSNPGTATFGQLVSDSYSYSDTQVGNHSESHTYQYDSFGRSSGRTTTINEPGQAAVVYAESTTYDEYGRVFQQFDASGANRGLRYVYASEGQLQRMREAAPAGAGLVYWDLLATDSRGQPTHAKLGNGIDVLATYEASTGRPQTLVDGSGGALVQNLQLQWDALGNLLARTDQANGRNNNDHFTYDQRNRLLTTMTCPQFGEAPCVIEQQQSYDAAGNILSKSDVGDYSYGSPRPHAVTQAGFTTYQYDANGNVSSDSSGRSFSYSIADQAIRITKGNARSEFHYGLSGQRIVRRDYLNNAVSSRTHYVGTVEVYSEAGSRRFRRMIGGTAIATWFEASGVTQVSYLHKDHLGSLVATTDANANITAEMNFDPWGARRNPSDWYGWQPPSGGQLSAMLAITPRGYTGHEHLEAVGVIHMNGRIYDAKLGRMLQADPFIEDTGTLNRYTYVHNNPLAYTDPSGYFSLGKFLRTVVAIAITVYTGGAAGGFWSFFGTALEGGAAFAAVVGAGAVSGALQSGTIEGAAWGAFSAAAFFGIGQGLAGAGEWANSGNFLGSGMSGAGFAVKTISHGLAGGAISRLQGGKFGHGFFSAAGSAATAPFANMASKAGVIRGAVVSTLTGGTLSKLSGGKFANGAVTAAMSYAFNQAASYGQKEMNALTRESQKLQEDLDILAFITEDEAAEWFNDLARRLVNKHGGELGANIVRHGKGFIITDVVASQYRGGRNVTIRPRWDLKEDWVATVHLHPGNDTFSNIQHYRMDGIILPFEGDIGMATQYRVGSYLGLANGEIHYFDGAAYASATGFVTPDSFISRIR